MQVIGVNKTLHNEYLPLPFVPSPYKSNLIFGIQKDLTGFFAFNQVSADVVENLFTSSANLHFTPLVPIRSESIALSSTGSTGLIPNSIEYLSLIPNQFITYNATTSQQFHPLGPITHENLSLENLEGIILGALLFLLLGILKTVEPAPAKSLDGELTIEQAAEILNTSEASLQKHLDQGAIPFTKVQGQPHIQLDDLMEYKKQRDARRRQALEEIIRLSEEAGLYEAERQE